MEPGEAPALSVLPHLPRIVAALGEGNVVVVAPPGSGKSTWIPPALIDGAAISPGQLLLAQPRRVAARAVVRRIASLRRVELGGEVGYHVRFDRCCTAQTKLVVATTGILLRRISGDLSLPGVSLVVLDEFHERTAELDLAVGMLRRIQQTIRPDLRIVAMSATIDAAPIARLLGDAPVFAVEGRPFPVSVRYEARNRALRLEQHVARAVIRAVAQTSGHLLVFLPGVGEIKQTRRALESAGLPRDVEIQELYGDLPAEAQDRVLAAATGRKIILATNIAETSLTIEGVTAVVDSGWMRQMTVDPDAGLPRLVLTPISKASAEQRAGRAGRVGPGICWRLWDEATQRARRDADLPEILRSDLADVVLRLLQWGERSVEQFPWLDPPPAEAVAAARQLLQRLGAVSTAVELTPTGRAMAELPVHPRLARLLLAGRRLGRRARRRWRRPS